MATTVAPACVQRLEDRGDRALGIDARPSCPAASPARSRTRRVRGAGRRCRDAAGRRSSTCRVDEQVGACRRRGAKHKASATGVCVTSAPRMLNTQAIESSAASTAASAPCLAASRPISRALLRRSLAGVFVGLDDQPRLRWAAGRSAQIASIGLRSTGTSRRRALASALRRLITQSPVCSQGRSRCARLRAHVRRANPRRWSAAPTGSSTRWGSTCCADLQRVAPVDEDRRLLGQHDGEPAEPSKPVSQASRCA